MRDEREQGSPIVPVTRRQLLRAAGIGGVAVGLPGVLAACGSGTSTPTGTGAGTGTTALSDTPVDNVTWAMDFELTTLDIARGEYMIRMHILATEPVVIHDDKLNVLGHLAESWKQVDDVTYVYKVRQGVKFWDGSPLTAEDMAYSMARHTDPKVGSLVAGFIPKMEFIKATGPDEVTAKLVEPNATWPHIPTYMLVSSKKYFEKYGKDFGATTAPKGNIMGTGPYIVERAKSGESIEYVRNESYWGKKPVAKRFKAVQLPDAQAAVLAARAGAFDGTFGILPPSIDTWKEVQGFHLSIKPATDISFASFDVETKPWDDVHVRRAFAYAFDREGIIKAVQKGHAQITNSIVPRNQWGALASEEKLDEIYNSLPVYDFDLDKARAELKKSAYPDGLTAKIWVYASGGAHPSEIAWAANLKEIGVTLKLEPVTDDEGVAREEEHRDLGLHIAGGWTPTIADPLDRPITLLPSSAATKGSFNEANYKNPEMDRLIRENLATSDPDRRIETLARIMQIAQEDLPYIPLWTLQSTVGLRDGLGYQDWDPWFETQFWIEKLKSAA